MFRKLLDSGEAGDNVGILLERYWKIWHRKRSSSL
jgi:translation elongation factor EF-Tu-like GTPase